MSRNRVDSFSLYNPHRSTHFRINTYSTQSTYIHLYMQNKSFYTILLWIPWLLHWWPIYFRWLWNTNTYNIRYISEGIRGKTQTYERNTPCNNIINSVLTFIRHWQVGWQSEPWKTSVDRRLTPGSSFIGSKWMPRLALFLQLPSCDLGNTFEGIPHSFRLFSRPNSSSSSFSMTRVSAEFLSDLLFLWSEKDKSWWSSSHDILFSDSLPQRLRLFWFVVWEHNHSPLFWRGVKKTKHFLSVWNWRHSQSSSYSFCNRNFLVKRNVGMALIYPKTKMPTTWLAIKQIYVSEDKFLKPADVTGPT